MSNPVCISPLKFYDSLAKQSHRKSYAYSHISPLFTKKGWIPPFQFVIPTSLFNLDGGLSTVKMYDAKTDNLVCNIPFLVNSNSYSSIERAYPRTNGSMMYVQTSNYISSVYDVSDLDKIYISGTCDSNSTAFNAVALVAFSTDPTFATFTHGFVRQPALGRILYEYEVDVPEHSGVLYACLLTNVFSFSDKSMFSKYTVENYNILACLGKYKISTSIDVPEGLYYLKLSSTNSIWAYYSEVFCFTNVTKDCLELEYWNETGNFAIKNGVIIFPSGFHFKLLLKSEIGKPEYNFEEESTKRLGYVYIESQVSKKTYKFNVVVPEYICDALRIVRLCDNKIIRCKDDEYEAISFEMEADWQTQGDLASVTCEFETDNVIANIGGFVPDKLGGDYNNDYDDDFDKE